MLKVLFIDIDGTIRENNKIDPEIIEAFKALKILGIKIILTTGRNFLHARKVARKLDVYPLIIACNGSLVKRTDNNEVIFESSISRATIRKVFDITKNSNCGLLAHEATNNFYIRNKDAISTNITGLTVTSYNYEQMLTLKHLLTTQIPEIAIVNSSKALTLEQKLPHKKYFYDLNLNDITKGSGLLQVLNYLDISPSDAMAIGDGNNDISMSKVVSQSVATQNATTDLKKTSTITLNEPLGQYLKKLVKTLKEKRDLL